MAELELAWLADELAAVVDELVVVAAGVEAVEALVVAELAVVALAGLAVVVDVVVAVEAVEVEPVTLSFCPTTIKLELAEMLFNALSLATVVLYFLAIAHSVSPDLTVYVAVVDFVGIVNFCPTLIRCVDAMLFNCSIDFTETPYFWDNAQTVSPDLTVAVVSAFAAVDDANNKPAAPTVPSNNDLVDFFKWIHSC